MAKIFWAVALAGLLLSHCQTAVAQEANTRPTLEVEAEEADYYYQQPKTYQPDARAIVRQRAMIRADQRNLRLASLAWYGMYNGRPTASPTPFSSMYSPTWQSPGGRPFAWSVGNRPSYIYLVR